MNIAKKNKLFAATLILILCVLSANFSAASMHHMDDSDCMVQVSCTHCFFPVEAQSQDFKYSDATNTRFLDIQFPLKINRQAPLTPPPKA